MFDANFDSQKLIFHPFEVGHWLRDGSSIGPIYTELELANRCNCKCLFCGVDHQVNETGSVMSLALAKKILSGLAELGNKSVMLCGHGEPLLNPDVVEIAAFAAERMSVSMTTNGGALSEEKLPLIDSLEWIRFSINGGSPENYAAVHGTTPDFFERVLSNVGAAVERKRALNLPVTIGTQLVLLPENESLVVDLARRLKEIGVDYFSIKPYSQHPLSRNRQEIDYRGPRPLEQELAPLADENFKVIFRSAAMQQAGRKKCYEQCYGVHFLSFISANGDVWACNVFAGDRRFYLGNGDEETIPAIWDGNRRKDVLSFISEGLDLGQCRDLCRMEACNRYLWRLRHPLPHDNFI